MSDQQATRNDRFLNHCIDRDRMHRMIDELPESALAVLVVRNADMLDWWFSGDGYMLWDVSGVLGTAVAKMHFNSFMRQYNEDLHSQDD